MNNNRVLNFLNRIFTTHKRSLRRLCFYTCLSVQRGRGSTWAGIPRTRYTPRTRCTPGPGTPPWTRYPWDQVHPLDQVHPQDQVHPPGPGTPSPDQVTPRPGAPPLPGAVHDGRYRQQAGGTHPTGMHSCLISRIS